MTADFVPYQEALELKALGFDINCFGYYDHTGELFFNTNSQPVGKDWVWKGNELLPTDMVLAPTLSQAFRWFREKYGLRIRNYGSINYSGGLSEYFEIFKYGYGTSDKSLSIETGALTYEEAELACLRKLIEIIKSQKE